MQETQKTLVSSLGWKYPLEKEMAAHSGILVWKIPWAEEPVGLQSMGSERVGHDWLSNWTELNWYINATFSICPTLSSCCVHKSILYVWVSMAE